jgi:hypothetical protein
VRGLHRPQILPVASLESFPSAGAVCVADGLGDGRKQRARVDEARCARRPATSTNTAAAAVALAATVTPIATPLVPLPRSNFHVHGRRRFRFSSRLPFLDHWKVVQRAAVIADAAVTIHELQRAAREAKAAAAAVLFARNINVRRECPLGGQERKGLLDRGAVHRQQVHRQRAALCDEVRHALHVPRLAGPMQDAQRQAVARAGRHDTERQLGDGGLPVGALQQPRDDLVQNAVPAHGDDAVASGQVDAGRELGRLSRARRDAFCELNVRAGREDGTHAVPPQRRALLLPADGVDDDEEPPPPPRRRPAVHQRGHVPRRRAGGDGDARGRPQPSSRAFFPPFADLHCYGRPLLLRAPVGRGGQNVPRGAARGGREGAEHALPGGGGKGGGARTHVAMPGGRSSEEGSGRRDGGRRNNREIVRLMILLNLWFKD